MLRKADNRDIRTMGNFRGRVFTRASLSSEQDELLDVLCPYGQSQSAPEPLFAEA